MERIKNIDFVGLTERFEDSVILCEKTFSWKLPRIPAENVSSEKKKPMKLTDLEFQRMRELLTEKNQLDLALYQCAFDEFQQKTAAVGVIS